MTALLVSVFENRNFKSFPGGDRQDIVCAGVQRILPFMYLIFYPGHD
ncbi:hypothetical protein D521_1300 [beta proteobacterium CB]|nr:hypothetical protein D521_1300 [beta proteobacterium CB]